MTERVRRDKEGRIANTPGSVPSSTQAISRRLITSALVADDGRALSRMLRHGLDPNAESSLGGTLLSAAIRCRKPRAAQVLVLHGANVRQRCVGCPLVNVAAHQESPRYLKIIVNADPTTVRQRDSCGRTPLHESCKFEKPRLGHVKLLLKHGAAINAKDRDKGWGFTPLHYAAWRGHLSVCKILIRSGARVIARDEEGQTPLHLAAWFGRVQVAKYLLEVGANRRARDSKGDTPVDLAEREGYPEMSTFLA